MKNAFLVVFAVVTVVSLTACGSKNKGWNVGVEWVDNPVVIEEIQQDLLADLRGKTPLTIEDLDKIDKYRFPASYTYTTYNMGEWGSVETWEYVYPMDDSYKLLLPIYENMLSRRIVSSVMSHDRINTALDIALDNGERCSITYVNDPDTLEYISALVSTPDGTLMYTFHY